MTSELKLLLIAFFLAAIVVGLIAGVGSQVTQDLSAKSAGGDGPSSLAVVCAVPLILGSIVLVMVLYANFRGNVEDDLERQYERMLRDKIYGSE